MRTHSQIIGEDGPHALARKLHVRLGGELSTVQSRVRGWALQGSIPSEYWPTLVDLGLATLDELSAAQEARKLPGAVAARVQDVAA